MNNETMKSRFIVIDGPDGAGKSTQIKKLKESLDASEIPAIIAIDPGGTDIGGILRNILLHDRQISIGKRCETLLFMASRAQLIEEVIAPALDEGKTIICDRFVSATLAYQGALGVNCKEMINLAEFAIDNIWPDTTIILDISPESGMRRIVDSPDRLESRTLEYHRNVRQQYLELADIYPTPIHYVDANSSIEEIHNNILEITGFKF